MKHGEKELDRKKKEWIDKNGWKQPKDTSKAKK
jgi:hypothetical protein